MGKENPAGTGYACGLVPALEDSYPINLNRLGWLVHKLKDNGIMQALSRCRQDQHLHLHEMTL